MENFTWSDMDPSSYNRWHMTTKTTRWQQRYENFDHAFAFLREAIKKPKLSALEISGLVKSFEFTFELGWKMLKDYLESTGQPTESPRDAIKTAFASQLIENGHTWIHMLEKRNELSHTYNETVAKKAVKIIKEDYFPAIEQVHKLFQQKKSAE